MGGGAQVGQVALGAISEADRHNIRGEHISVIRFPSSANKLSPPPSAPVAGSPGTCAGTRRIAHGRRYRSAVREVRAEGLLVVSLNMAGSVPDASDLVVSDPVQAGVMTVMAVADTAKFTVERLNRRVF